MSNVDNGQRVEIDWPEYRGTAGFVVRGDQGIISFRSPKNSKTGEVRRIGDSDWVVERGSPSDYVKGFRKVHVRKVDVQ